MIIYSVYMNPAYVVERIWSHTNWTIRFSYQSMIQPLALVLLPEGRVNDNCVLAINDLCPPLNCTLVSRNGHKHMNWVGGTPARIPSCRVAVIQLTNGVLNLMNGIVYSAC